MAFKVLSPAAVWFLVMLLRQFNARAGGYSHLVLPYRQVKWKLSWMVFQRARQELIDNGFIKLMDEGGFRTGGKSYRVPAIYALSNGVEARCAALAKDEAAGRCVGLKREWYPFKRSKPKSAENLERARAKLAEGKLFQKRPRHNKGNSTHGRKGRCGRIPG